MWSILYIKHKKGKIKIHAALFQIYRFQS